MSELRVINVTGPDGNPTAKFNGVERPEVPPGAVLFFAATTPPPGFLKANGATISRAVYAKLFAAVGTTFGAGDGSTTFNLPDLRGEFLRGLDDGRGVDAARALGSSQDESFKAHTHNVPMYQGTAWTSAIKPTSDATGTTNVTTTSSTGGSETRPRNVALLACIKY